MEKIIGSSKEELTLCPGLGPLKVLSNLYASIFVLLIFVSLQAKRLHSLFHESFIVKKKQSME